MSTSSEIRAFLVTDLVTLLTSAFPVGDGDCYFDRQTRSKRERSEITLTMRTQVIEEADLGDLYANTVTIELFRAQGDPYWKSTFRSELEEARTVLLRAYHNNIDRFQAAITADVDYVLCHEVGPPQETDRNEEERTKLSQFFLLEIGTWES